MAHVPKRRIAAAFFSANFFFAVPALSITFSVTGLFLLLLAASLGHLTVEDQGESGPGLETGVRSRISRSVET